MTSPDPNPSQNLVRHRGTWAMWGFAFAMAVGVHAGAIAAAVADMREAASDELGAPALEIGIELASPVAEPSDLPPGPESEASTASTAQVEQRAETERTDLPKDTPVESEDPDRVVSPEPATEKPKEEQPTPTVQNTNASEESAASEATAPPVIDKAPEAPVSRAPVQGTGASTAKVRTTWQRQLVAHLDRNKRYPGGAKRTASQVLVSFTLDRTGKVVQSAVVQSSGDAAFDEAALAMLRRASPVPQPPALVADEGLTFTVPVLFRNGRG